MGPQESALIFSDSAGNDNTRSRPPDEFDCAATQCYVVILNLLFQNRYIASGAPPVGENREAGEIPARSRHCNALEVASYRATDRIGKAAGDEDALLNARLRD